MTLRELLAERQPALCARWRDAILAEYGEATAARWRRVRDPFANPFGHALATGLPELLQAAAAGGEPTQSALEALEAIVRIRSVQGMPASRAVGFVLALRGAVREELQAELAGGAHAERLAALDAGAERLTLRAFDVYVRIRDQVHKLRQDELKRSVASILRRWHGGELPEPPPELVSLSAPVTARGGGG
jgi:hypothetical protein